MIKNLFFLIFILGISYFFQTYFEYAYLIEIGLSVTLTYFYVQEIKKEKKEVKTILGFFKELYDGVEGLKKSDQNKDKLFKIFDKINSSK